MSPEIKNWKSMIDSGAAILKKRTGDDVGTWVARACSTGARTEAALREWLGGQGVTGYGQDAVIWEVCGYPEFLLKSAAELIDGQYADRPGLRPVADALLQLAADMDGVEIQARKTLIALQSPRRKFAQIQATTKSAVDLVLRLDQPVAGRLEQVKTPAGDPFSRRVRLRSADDADAEVAQLLAAAARQNS